MNSSSASIKAVPRREGAAKVTGAIRYVDDLPLEDFLWGATVRSMRFSTTRKFLSLAIPVFTLAWQNSKI